MAARLVVHRRTCELILHPTALRSNHLEVMLALWSRLLRPPVTCVHPPPRSSTALQRPCRVVCEGVMLRSGCFRVESLAFILFPSSLRPGHGPLFSMHPENPAGQVVAPCPALKASSLLLTERSLENLGDQPCPRNIILLAWLACVLVIISFESNNFLLKIGSCHSLN